MLNKFSVGRCLANTYSLKSRILDRFIVLVISSLIVTSSYAQNAKQVIVYKDFFLNTNASSDYLQSNLDVLDSYGYGLTYHKNLDERRYRQWEAKMYFNNTNDKTQSIEIQEYRLEYRRGKYWKRSTLKRIRIKHSMAACLNFRRQSLNPLQNTVFRKERKFGSLGLSYLLGLEMPLTKEINIHVDSSILDLDFGYDETQIKNPTLTLPQQKQGGFDFDLMLPRTLKIGIGISF